uniref:NADH-ubiquinone oxidoreductase chain 3 n=1 Tax=Achatinella mustelina TaxID=115943 RepID=A0A2Z1P4L4_9EUPU|nr:NADH dehydrogenase subunit 3 [Achatinella mustelina]ANC62887.1 NADH dehydrogenase subunit 3 [Achatinella mustelina]
MFFMGSLSLILIPLVMMLLYYFIYWKSYEQSHEKTSPFECGFNPMSNMRKPFSLRFFMLLILFLVFDVELVLMFPLYSVLHMNKSMLTIFMFYSFIMLLLIGLLYEWFMGMLDWSKS